MTVISPLLVSLVLAVGPPVPASEAVDLAPRLPSAAPDSSAEWREARRERTVAGLAAISGGAVATVLGIRALRDARNVPRSGLAGPVPHGVSMATAIAAIVLGAGLGLVGGCAVATPPPGAP